MARGSYVAWAETNLGSLKDARRLQRVVLDARLAACANLWPIESAYWWEGEVEEAREVRVIFKTDRTRVAALVALVEAEHPYRVPYLAWGQGERVTPAYSAWARRETARPQTRRAPARRGRASRGTRRKK